MGLVTTKRREYFMDIIKIFLIFIISLNLSAARIGTTDPFLDINMGKVPGKEMYHKFGWRGNATTVHAQVWNSPTVVDMIYPTVGETLTVTSSDANDTFLGSGGRAVYLECLDSTTWKPVTQIVNMNGLSGVVSTINCIRFQRAWVIDVGIYGGKNLGLITIAGTTSGNPYGYLEAEEARTQNSQFTCPDASTCYIVRTSITVDAKKEASFSLHAREGADIITAPFKATRIVHEWDGITASTGEKILANHKFPERTDLYFDGQMSTGTGILQLDYDIVIIAN